MRLFASDFDGTFAFMNQVPEENYQAVEKLRKAGHHFAIVTGRSWMALTDNIRPVCDYILAVSGGYVTDAAGRVLYRSGLTHSQVDRLLCILRESDAWSYELSDGALASLTFLIPPEEHPYSSANLKKFKKSFSGVEAELLAAGNIVQVSVTFADEKSRDRTLGKLKAVEGIQPHINGLYVDITNCESSKRKALERLGLLNAYEEIYTVGDAMNDYGMIQAFHGFAMDSGCQELKKVARRTVSGIPECVEMILQSDRSL